MSEDLNKVKMLVRNKIIELARENKIDAHDLKNDDTIPEKGYLDSGAIIELIVWYEQQFNLEINDGEITIDNFGSVNAMADYIFK